MNQVSFKLLVSSRNVALLEELQRLSCFGSEIIINDGIHTFCALLIKTQEYDTCDEIKLLIKCIRRILKQSTCKIYNGIEFTVEIDIVVNDADETSIPSIIFPSEYIDLAAGLNIITQFYLKINSSTKKGSLNSGAYFYIESENEIDVPVLNNIAGIQPSIVYRRGEKGRSKIMNFNVWGVELFSDNQLPNVSVSALMRVLWNSKKIGLFCKKNKCDSHIDVTCYSIYSEPICFQLCSSFFSFAKTLYVRYISMDFMN